LLVTDFHRGHKSNWRASLPRFQALGLRRGYGVTDEISTGKEFQVRFPRRPKA
jgi:hypothetical protein